MAKMTIEGKGVSKNTLRVPVVRKYETRGPQTRNVEGRERWLSIKGNAGSVNDYACRKRK